MPRPAAGGWLAGACLLVGLTVGLSHPAFAGEAYLKCLTTTVNEGESFQVAVIHFGENHPYGAAFWTQPLTAGTSDFQHLQDVGLPLTTNVGAKYGVATHNAKEATISTKQDDVDEGDETFIVRITDRYLVSGGFDSCEITIKDDDLKFTGPPPTWAAGALVSNAGKPSEAELSFAHDVAQQFTTGSNNLGYTLTGVDLVLRGGSGQTPAYTVTIRSDAGGNPGAIVGTLANPAWQSGDHNARFTAPGPIFLAANALYWVVVDVINTDSTSLIWGTNSNQQHAGAPAGWRIANGGRWRGAAATAWQARTGKMKIAVHGSALTGNSQHSAMVSNMARATDTNAFFDDYAQAFTTGDHPAGYKLTGADIGITVTNPSGHREPAYAVHVYSDASGKPGLSLGALRKPSSLNVGGNHFTASFGGIDLRPATTYWVVLDAGSEGNRIPRVKLTASDVEDSGKAAGWGIADSGLRRSGGTWTAMAFSRAMQISAHGYPKAASLTVSQGGGLVSNTGQANAGSVGFTEDHAQAFTTGSNAGGYTLTEVDLDMWVDPGPQPGYSVQIRSDRSNYPRDTLATLSNPASLSTGINRFTAVGAGLALRPDKQYWVVVDVASGANDNVGWRVTDATDEDAGAARGWRMDAARHGTAGNVGGTWHAARKARKMAVHGIVKVSAGVPAIPVAPEVSTTDGTELNITWQPPAPETPGVDDYDVRFRRRGDAAWTSLDRAVNTTSSTITGLTQGATWEAQVRATNSLGSSDWSASGEGHTGPARLVSATSHANGTTNGSTITLAFTKRVTYGGNPPNSSHYSVLADGDGRTLGNVVITSDGKVELWLSWRNPDHTLQGGETVTVGYTQHSGRSALRDADGLEVASFSSHPVTSLAPTSPSVPPAPTVTWDTGTRRLLISWTPPHDGGSTITDYDLRFWDGGTGDPPNEAHWVEPGDTRGLDHVGTATSATRVAGPNKSYSFQVRATNSLGTGPWSASGSVTTGNMLPTNPQQPTVTAVTGSPSSLEVSWQAPDDGGSTITDYDLRYYQGVSDPADEADWVTANETTGLPRTATAATSWTITGLAANTFYRVQVRAVNAVGEGPWSPSSGSTPTNGSTSTTNNSPIRMRLGVSGCVKKNGNDRFASITAAAITLVKASPLLSQALCEDDTTPKAPMFSDPDGDDLTFTAQVRNLPDNIILGDGFPNVRLARGVIPGDVEVVAAARFARTDLIIDVTATDPHGASASTFFRVRVGAFGHTAAPAFEWQQGLLRVAENEPMTPVVLPAASGGDVGRTHWAGDFRFPYLYRVDGLPDGLVFDPATRELTGTPSEAGAFDITYTVEDADTNRDAADKATQTFTVVVGDGPKIDHVRIVSHPTYDANNDGRNDTYVHGDRILVDVEFGAHQPVQINGNRDNVRLRLDLGADSDTRAANRKVLKLHSLLNGQKTLRFAYTVEAGDSDTDGVWVQTGDSSQVVFLSGVTITHADTGAGADLTRRGLPTRGNPLARVDGSKSSAHIGPKPTAAAVDGNTLTVTFDKELSATFDKFDLRFDTTVEGAGGVERQHPTKSAVSKETVTENGVTTTKGLLTLTLGTAARPGDAVTVSYVGSTLKGTGGKKVARFRDLAVGDDSAGTAGPGPLRATASATELRLVFDGALNPSSVPAGDAFLVWTAANTDYRSIRGTGTTAIGGSGDTVVTVTLAAAVRAGELVMASYQKPDTDPLQGAGAGNPDVLSFRSFRVETVADALPPVLLDAAVTQTSATPAESKLALYFDEPLDAASEPGTGDFAVSVSGAAATVSDVAVEGGAVLLTLDRLAASGTVFALSHSPGANPIRDISGNAAKAFRQHVTAGVDGAPLGQSALVDGSRIVLTYDRPLDPASVPALGAFTLHRTALQDYTEDDLSTYDSVATVTVAGNSAVLRLENKAVQPCDAATPFTLSYAVPTGFGAAPLRGLDGTAAAPIFHVNVTNARAHLCGVDGIESAVSGSVILYGKRPFATHAPPEPEWFTVNASGGPVTVTAAAFSPTNAYEVRLSLSREFEPGETATVSYARPQGAAGLWDAAGSQLADVIELPVIMRDAPPAALAAPAVTQASATSLAVSWLAAETSGQTAVSGFGVRYRQEGATAWTGHAHAGTGTTATIDGLTPGRRYEAQVRANGAGGDGPWSESGWGHTGAARFDSATTPAGGGSLILTFTKDILFGGLHTHYTVQVGGEGRETLSVAWEGNTVSMELAEPVYAGEAVTVAYAKPASGTPLRDADELAIESFGPETVVNASTEEAPSGPALTAAFEGVPARHDGATPFTFDLVFSEDFGGRLDYRVLRDEALSAAGGSVTDARRAARGHNQRWTITVQPRSTDDVTVTLSATTDCATDGAICAPDGRPLSNAPSATVAGPPPNAPATGAPVIAGAAQAGETLTASSGGIADADGLTGAVFAWQWMASDGGGDTDMPGATGSSYTLSDLDVGRAFKVRVTFTDDAGNVETLTSASTEAVAARPNRPATGAPVIAGAAQAGETLSASTDGIADADGLTGAVFAYQWMANDGGGDADIAGATGASYTLGDADVGQRIKVRVSFTDDGGHAESLTSAPTAAVLPRPLTASFEGVPAEHDGKKLFSFELVFSDNFAGRFDYKVLRDQALQVNGGRAVEATRLASGRNDRWTIKVRPGSYEAVTVTLAAGSVTTESGRTLSNTVTATVTGPALLSVADARASEGQDAAVDFAVTLSRAASSEVTVEYVTQDGTAVTGEDYTRTRGTLTFAPGETEKTVSVPILDDAIDEGEETFTLKLRNANGAYIVDDEATGTIENDDPMAKAWTARFGRTVAVHVVDAVEARLDGATPESWMQLGGHRLGGGGPDVQETVQRLAPDRDLWEEAESGDPAGAQHLTFRDLLLGSSFHLVSNGEERATGPRLSAWGRVATSGFDGREDALTLDGTVTTATLGVDGAWKRWITGLVLAYSEGDGSFSQVGTPGGDVSSSLTSLHPYVAYTLSDRVRLWGLVGYGSGALRLQEIGRSPIDTDLSMTMGALGVRGDLLRPSPRGGLQLALRSDVLWTGMDSARVEGRMAATEAQASRLRLVLEGSRPVALAGGGAFVPSLEVGLRHDGGDADTGTGVEVGGRLRFTSAGGLSIEASVRGLLAHEAEDYTEWGASAALRYDPGRQGRGFTAAIVPTWGMAGSGVQQLWGQQTTAGLAPLPGVVAPTAAGRVEAELGYGLAALKGRGLLTPYARVALTEGTDQAWHLGTRLTVAESLNLSLEASRRASEGGPTAHDLALLATLGF